MDAKLVLADDETKLVGVILEGGAVGDDQVEVAAKVPSLLRLSLAGSRVSKRGIRSLRALPQLVSLNLSHTRWTSGAIEDLAGLPALSELRLDDCEWLRDGHLIELASLPNLQSLSLSGTAVSGIGIDHLRRLPSLKHVNLDRCPSIDDSSIEILIGLGRERNVSMDLSGTEVTRAGLSQLRQALPAGRIHMRPESMVGLRDIADRGQFSTNPRGGIHGFRRRTELDGTPVPLQIGDLSVVGTVSELVDLNLERTNVNDEMLLELKGLPHLETLRLCSTFVSDEGLRVLAEFPNLKSLWLLDTDIDGAGLVHLRHVPRLMNLKIQSRRGDEVLSHLECLDGLQMLTICAPLTNDGMDRLAGHLRLSFLALIETRVRSPGIAKLNAISTLRELRFDGGLVDDSDLDAIASLKSLKHLAFTRTRVTSAGRDRLSALRPDLTVFWSGRASLSDR
jgi:Leucine-rich repeat (LRR) protein